MKITKTYNWNRRDFYFDATCEHCGAVEKDNSGYDDDNYYNNVMPNRKCKSCGESSNSKGTAESTTPRYNPTITM